MTSFKIRIVFSIAFLFFIKMHSQDSLQTIVAVKGDGIYSILRKQGRNPVTYYADFITLNKKNLKNKEHIYEGRTYIIPPKIKDSIQVVPKVEKEKESKEEIEGVAYPIFGKKYEKVKAKSTKLKGTVYYLISGHGGPDPGALTTYKGKIITEDEYAYDITLRLGKELISHGALVYFIIRDPNDGIRDETILKIDRDEVNYPKQVIPLNQVARLKLRVKAVNNLYAKHKGKYQRLIVTHIDSRLNKRQEVDVFFYHHKKSKKGKRLAESVRNTFRDKYKKHQPNRGYGGTFNDREIYLVNNTIPPMVYIEIGNIQNKKDQKRILDFENRDALAKWISQGVLLDYSLKK
ncbi:MAG: N-acetylmuramoyl-L-alanine amidase [Cellulophaga sp.]